MEQSFHHQAHRLWPIWSFTLPLLHLTVSGRRQPAGLEPLETPPPRLTRVITYSHSRADKSHLCWSSRNWAGSAPHLQSPPSCEEICQAPNSSPTTPDTKYNQHIPAFPHLPEPESQCQASLISYNPPWGDSVALGQERSFWLLILQLLVPRQFRLLTQEREKEE